MAPALTATQTSRNGTKSHITKHLNLILGLKTEIMTLQLLAELDLYASRVQKHYETYKNYATTIQSELSAANASQQQYEDEAEEKRQTDEDVEEAKSITRLKKKEWELIEKKKEQDEADRREAERNKPTLQLLRQLADQMKLMQQQQAAAVPGTLSSASSTVPTAATPSVTGATTTRLPQRQIRHFKGDILEWTSFWETFNAAIHTSSIPTVQKFDYLKEYLKGDARLIVENLELSDTNYQLAIDELKRTYGKKEVLIEAHMEKLDSLQPVKDPKEVTALRHLQLTIQSHITALESLGQSKTSYGSYLGRRLMKLLPNKLQEKWAEEATNDVTDIECVLKFIREQTEATERSNRIKTASRKPLNPLSRKRK